MKFAVLVLACLCACVFADDRSAQVIHSDAEVNPDSFKYAYEIDNHIRALQSGKAEGKENWIVSGEYEYLSPEGKTIKVTYTADETGYHPTVHHS